MSKATVETAPDSVVIAGVTYVPASTIQQDHSGSPVRIVILQRGWVMVGRWSQDGENCALDGARIIRRWGTSNGLGELVNGPLSTTTLDPAGHVEFHILGVVASLAGSEDGWVPHLG